MNETYRKTVLKSIIKSMNKKISKEQETFIDQLPDMIVQLELLKYAGSKNQEEVKSFNKACGGVK